MTTRFQVNDASCGHCKSTIESAVTSLGAVMSAELDLATKVLTVQHEDSVTATTLAVAIQSAGYTPEPVA